MLNRVFSVNMIGVVSVVCLLLVVSHQTTARKLRKFLQCMEIIFFLMLELFLAPYIKPCNPARNDWSKCLLQAVEDIRPYLPDGIPEMHIPRMEPLLVTSAALDSPNFSAIFENILLSGLTKFKLRHVDFDLNENVGRIGVDFDEVGGVSDYRVKGRILILDLNGFGKANATFCK